ncbi:unnamed protein product, partial [Oppiella nova]
GLKKPFFENFRFWKNDPISPGLRVNTTSGIVRGQTIHVLNIGINQFLNIPYAEPPVGKLRFNKPLPIQTPRDIDATKPGNSCLQPVFESIEHFMGNLTTSEDCLVLNIWTLNGGNSNSSQESPLKPVMFWIHGGGLYSGSIFQRQYNGSALAAQNVVFVSANYRLGPFGFLYGDREDAPGNVGFYDQLLALKWVRENIHAFGGDRDQITIFGQSAGSWSVSAHILSPLSAGAFQRAIMESGAHLYNKDRDLVPKSNALYKAKQMAIQLNCSLDDNQWLECLRGIDGKEFYSLYTKNPLTVPTLDTEFLPMSAQMAFKTNHFNKVDILSGVTLHEGSWMTSVILGEVPHNLTETDFTNFVHLLQTIFPYLDANNITDFYLGDIDKTSSHDIQWAMYDLFGDLFLTCPTYMFATNYAKYSQ